MEFSAIPERSPGPTDVSWWNSLRTAGIQLATRLSGFMGGGALVETAFTIADNQVAAADVTGLVFDKALYRSAVVEFQMRRKTDSSERMFNGRMTLQVKADAWLEPVVEGVGDETGVTFSITATGQVQYVSDDQTGSNYVGQMRFKAQTFSI